MLTPAGGVKQGFGATVHRRVPLVEDDVPDLLGNRGAARFAGQNDGNPFAFQAFLDGFENGAFPASFPTFECDETVHRVFLPSKAFSRVSESAYSRLAPMGNP